jgi:hypothetical protein
MSHSRARGRFGQDAMWRIQKPFNLEIGDWVLSHGNGRLVYPAKIIHIDDKEVLLSNSHKLNRTGILARIVEGNINHAPRGVLVQDIKDVLNDLKHSYGMLRVETYADWAMELQKEEQKNG